MIDPIAEYLQECHNTPRYEKCVLRGLWHYPAMGELPPIGEPMFVAFKIDKVWDYAKAEYYEGGWASAIELGEVLAWQYIEPPGEEYEQRLREELYEQELEQSYEQEQEEYEQRLREELLQNYDFDRGDVKY